MGKLGYDPVITHFSHEHSLQLCNLSKNTQSAVSCFGCNLNCRNWVYTCKVCNCFLHITCSKMPLQITHPSHPYHALALLPAPAYPEGAFNCNACGRQGSGFCYHCKSCELDLHILCASYPLSLSHHAHHCTLNLAFSPPYANKVFRCDVCNDSGSKYWLYRCDPCGFDAHLGCATAMPESQMGTVASNSFEQKPLQSQPPPPPPTPRQQQLPMYRQQKPPLQGMGTEFGISGNTPFSSNVGVRYLFNPQQFQPPLQEQQHKLLPSQIEGTQLAIPTGGFASKEINFNHPNYFTRNPNPSIPGYVQPVGTSRILVSNAINGFVEGLSQQVGQSLVQGILGGSGGNGGGGVPAILSSIIGGGGFPNLDIGTSILGNVIGFN